MHAQWKFFDTSCSVSSVEISILFCIPIFLIRGEEYIRRVANRIYISICRVCLVLRGSRTSGLTVAVDWCRVQASLLSPCSCMFLIVSLIVVQSCLVINVFP